MKFSLLVCLFMISVNSYAGINKWTDSEGKVHYSDMMPAEFKAKTVRTTSAPQGMPAASGVAAPKTLAEREAEWKKSQTAKEEAAQKAAKEEEATAAKQKNCDNARGYLATLENSPALVTYNEKGERTVLDDASRKQKTDEARKSVSDYCN